MVAERLPIAADSMYASQAPPSSDAPSLPRGFRADAGPHRNANERLYGRAEPVSENPHLIRGRCSRTGNSIELDDFVRPIGLCGCCAPPGAPVMLEYDLEAIRRSGAPLGSAQGPGIWRFAALLPVLGVGDEYAADVGRVAIHEHARLGAEHDVESVRGARGKNPTGSFKDRGLSVACALATLSGARRVCLPTQGNAGIAAAFFSARAALEPALVFMPEGYQGSTYDRAARLFGAELRFAGQNVAEAGRAMRAELRAELSRGELVDLSTFFEPGRLEGKKTMGLEIYERFGPRALPDWVIYPTGGGTGLVGIWKAFDELAGLGLLPSDARRPRLVAVQAEGCAPLVGAFEQGLDTVQPVESKGTIADGLDVPAAIMGHRMLSAIRESHGLAMSVKDSAILKAYTTLGCHGIPSGYEGAATLAALSLLRARGVVEPQSRVLLLITSSPLITLGRVA